jgi:putative transposase
VANRILSAPCTGNWLPTSSKAPAVAAIPAGPGYHQKMEALVVRFARENRGWGYDRIVGALANLGHAISDRTVGNILRRQNIAPAPERSRTTTWKEFIRSHMDVLAGADFFTCP